MKFGSRFSPKATTPSTKSWLLALVALRLSLGVQLPGEVGVHPPVQQPLRAGIGGGRPLGEPLQQGGGNRPELVVWDHLVDQAPIESPLRRDALAEHRHLGCTRVADAGGEEGGRAAVRDEPDVDERQQQIGRLGGDDQVCGQRQRATDPDRRPVDGGDHRLRHLAESRDDRVVDVLEPRAQVRQATVIRAPRCSFRSAPDENPRPAPVISSARIDSSRGDAGNRVVEVLAELLVPGVERVGAIEQDPGR